MLKNILFFLLLNSLLIAKDQPPLAVVADQMTYNDKTKVSKAIGNAVATFHNTDGKQVLQADSMTAHHSTDDINGIDTLHAKSTSAKPVLFKSSSLTVTANACKYDGKVQTIFCTGCVKVTDLKKKDTVTGDKVTINIETKVYSVESVDEHLSEAIVHNNSAAPDNCSHSHK